MSVPCSRLISSTAAWKNFTSGFPTTDLQPVEYSSPAAKNPGPMARPSFLLRVATFDSSMSCLIDRSVARDVIVPPSHLPDHRSNIRRLILRSAPLRPGPELQRTDLANPGHFGSSLLSATVPGHFVVGSNSFRVSSTVWFRSNTLLKTLL